MSTVFFTDRDLGKGFPNALIAAGLEVKLHQDHFPQNCPDAVWLEEVGKRGWVVITHDGRIRYKPNELDAVMKHGVALLVVIGAVPHRELAAGFVATLERILKFMEARKPPYIAKVYRPSSAEVTRKPDAQGRIELWYPLPES